MGTYAMLVRIEEGVFVTEYREAVLVDGEKFGLVGMDIVCTPKEKQGLIPDKDWSGRGSR